MRISDWSSDVCSSDLIAAGRVRQVGGARPVEARHGTPSAGPGAVRAPGRRGAGDMMSDGQESDICLIVEGAYPFVVGGVSSWLQDLILAMPDQIGSAS